MDRTNALNYLLSAGKRLYRDRSILAGLRGTSHMAADRNAVQEEIVGVIEAAGIAPDAEDWTQLLAAILAFSGGLVGTARNLRGLLTAAGTSLTLSADEILVKTSLGGRSRVLPSYSQVLNLGTTGAGGMDTGAAPATGFVAIYAIFNPTTGVSALLGQAAGSARAEIYGGANMPAGYTYSALLAVWPTDGSGNLIAGIQADRRFSSAQRGVYSGAFLGGPASLALSGVVPPNARRVRGYAGYQSSDPTAAVAATFGGSSLLFDVNSGSDLGQGSVDFDLQMTTPQQLHWQTSCNIGSFGVNVFITGYEI